MTWKYCYPEKEATHRPTNLTFSISYDPVSPTWKISPSSGEPGSTTNAEVSRLILELNGLIEDGRNQRHMSTLLHGEFGGDYGRTARILHERTKRRVSTRTLQAWMMPADRPSSRRCPAWAVAALEEYLTHNPNEPAQWRLTAEIQRGSPENDAFARLIQLHEQKTLKYAEFELSDETLTHKEWKECSLESLPARMAKVDLARKKRDSDFSELFGIIFSRLHSCSTFDEFKREVLAAVDQKDRFDKLVAEAESDIKQRRKEFSTDDGTLPE